MPPPRTGSVEAFRRANGTTYYRARIRLADGTRARVDVPEKYSRAAGGKSGDERAELYALAVQEREDETGELLDAKRKRAVEILRPPRPVALDGSVASGRRVLEVVAAHAPLSLAGRPLPERAFAAMAMAR